MATSKQYAKKKGITERHARRLAAQKKVSAAKPGRDWDIKTAPTSKKKSTSKKRKS